MKNAMLAQDSTCFYRWMVQNGGYSTAWKYFYISFASHGSGEGFSFHWEDNHSLSDPVQ